MVGVTKKETGKFGTISLMVGGFFFNNVPISIGNLKAVRGGPFLGKAEDQPLYMWLFPSVR